MNSVALGYRVARSGIPAPRSFRRWVDAAIAMALPGKSVELAIQLVEADEARMFNQQYRGRDYPTNVLSFPAAALPGQPMEQGPRHIGDLVICAPVVARESREQSKPLAAHYAHLSVHGVLHLLGYDHEEELAAQQMEALETQILASLGLPDPYLLD